MRALFKVATAGEPGQVYSPSINGMARDFAAVHGARVGRSLSADNSGPSAPRLIK